MRPASEAETIEAIAAQVERHRHQGRAVFSTAGIQTLLKPYPVKREAA